MSHSEHEVITIEIKIILLTIITKLLAMVRLIVSAMLTWTKVAIIIMIKSIMVVEIVIAIPISMLLIILMKISWEISIIMSISKEKLIAMLPLKLVPIAIKMIISILLSMSNVRSRCYQCQEHYWYD